MTSADEQPDLEPKSNALLSALTSYGPLVVLTIVAALHIDTLLSPAPEPKEPPTYYTSVAVTVVAGDARERALQFTGQALPERQVSLRVAQDARVTRVPVRLGEQVVAGQTICELRYNGNRNTVALTTPINGRVQTLAATPGSTLKRGSNCGSVVDTSSIVVQTQVRPHEAFTITAGDRAEIAIDGERRGGRVHYVEASGGLASDGTRSLEIHTDDNTGMSVGDSATIEIRTLQVDAAVVPQNALLMVPGKGMSVQMVSGDGPTGVVVTVPVEVVAATPDGLYVRGLPANGRLIVRDRNAQPNAEGEVVRIGRVT
ncbi:MAG: HlyD family efflux transporter periplasmic adaptor subunit [Pseudomonadota bacterium]